MCIYGTSRTEAQRIADGLTGLIGGPVRFTEGLGRTVMGYIVGSYPGTSDFGITERWTYDGRPDLSEFGGGFIDLRRARELVSRTC